MGVGETTPHGAVRGSKWVMMFPASSTMYIVKQFEMRTFRLREVVIFHK